MTEVVEQLISCIKEELGDEEQSKKVMRRILKEFGGCSLYIPLESRTFRNENEAEIFDRHDGSTASARKLAKEYNIALNTFYTIIKREHERRFKKAQYKLFGD